MNENRVQSFLSPDKIDNYSYEIESFGIHQAYVSKNADTWNGYNSTNPIILEINCNTEFYFLQETDSHLEIEFEHRPTVNTVTLSNNPMNYLFRQMDLKIGNKEIEVVQYPGILTDIEYHLKRSYEETECSRTGIVFDGPYSAAADDAYSTITAVGKITRSKTYNEGYWKRKNVLYPFVDNTTNISNIFVIPLRDIFKFCEKMDSPITLTSIHLKLYRAPLTDNKCIFGSDGSIDYKTQNNGTGIKNITLKVVTGKLSSLEEAKYWERIKSNIRIDFLSRYVEHLQQVTVTKITKAISLDKRPRFFLIIAKRFVDSEDAEIKNNSQLMAHCNIKSISIGYGEKTYPAVKQEADFTKGKAGSFYNDYIGFCNAMGFRSCMSEYEFINFYTIFVVNTECQVKNTIPSYSFNVSIERHKVPTGNEITIKNPAAVDYYIIPYLETHYEINMSTNTLNPVIV